MTLKYSLIWVRSVIQSVESLVTPACPIVACSYPDLNPRVTSVCHSPSLPYKVSYCLGQCRLVVPCPGPALTSGPLLWVSMVGCSA